MKITIRTTPLIFKSIILSLLIFSISYDFLFDVVDDYQGYQLILTNTYIFIAIFTYLILFLIKKCIYYEINKRCIKIIFKFFNKVYVKEYYIINKVSYEIVDNPFLSFGYESRIKIFDTKNQKKIISFVIKKDDIKALESIINENKEYKKEPYYKSNKYFKDYKAMISFIIFGFFFYIITLMLIYLVIGITNIFYEINDFSIYLSIFIFTTIFFGIIIIYYLIKYQNISLKIEKDYVLINDGVIFKRKIFISRNNLLEFNIISYFLNKLFNNYFLSIRLSSFNRVFIPIHKENISYLTNVKPEDLNAKIKPLYKELIISILIIIIFFILILFKSIITAILFLIITVPISFYLFLNSKTYVKDKRLILLNSFLFRRTKFIDISKIKNIKLKKSFKENNILSFKINNRKIIRIISEEEKNSLLKK